MQAVAIRNLVERLLAGERQADAVRQILLYVRTRSYGNPLIQEIGHFAAHFDERDRGLVWKRVVNFAINTEFQLRLNIDPWKTEYPPDRPLMEAALPACLQLMGPADVRKRVGFGYDKAQRALARGIPKIDQVTANGLTVREEMTREERVVVETALSFIVTPKPIRAETMVCEIAAALLKNKLLLPDERQAFLAIGDYLSVFVIAMMHQTAILFPGRSSIKLEASYVIGPQGPAINVSGSFKIEDGPRFHPGAACDVLRSTLNPSEWCEPSLVVDGPGIHRWMTPIEQAPDGRLRAA